jgi:hypothetical protein
MTLHGSMLSYIANSHDLVWDDYREVKPRRCALVYLATFSDASLDEVRWTNTNGER